MALAASDPSRPKGERKQDDQAQYPNARPRDPTQCQYHDQPPFEQSTENAESGPVLQQHGRYEGSTPAPSSDEGESTQPGCLVYPIACSG
jgi:hypothetical protein